MPLSPSHPARGNSSLVIYGAGGHGQVIAEAANAMGIPLLGFLDDQRAATSIELQAPMLAPDDPRLDHADFIVAVGDNAARQRIMQRLVAARRSLVNIIHPTAYVSASATLGTGVFIAPGAIVQTHACLDDGVIVNSGAIVEHHARIGQYAHLAPGVVIGGTVRIGSGTLVGLGARILPGINIGENGVVGAGAVVIHDIPDHQTVVGVPAHPTN